MHEKLVRAECVRCPWLLAQTKVATIFITFLLEYNLTEPEYNLTEPEYNLPEPAVIQNHRRGCRIVSNFCMGPYKKIIKIWVKKI
jgi:hypothetical protein